MTATRPSAQSDGVRPHPDGPASVPRSPVTTVLWFAAVGVLVTFLLASASWWLAGGRDFVVSTPSMSPKVPVGSLVFTRPVPPGGPKVGQIIAFHPPTEPNATYTHRVYKILPGPAYQTKGDLDTSPDAWVVLPKDIIGVSSHHYRGLGFVVRGLPWLALGTVIVVILAGLVSQHRRRLTYLVGGSVVVAVAMWTVNPLVRGVFVESGLVHHRLRALVVNTGLLPIRFTMKGAAAQHTAGGYPATLNAKPPASGSVFIHGNVDLSILEWILLGLVCATPLLIALLLPHERVVDPVPAIDHGWTETDAVIEPMPVTTTLVVRMTAPSVVASDTAIAPKRAPTRKAPARKATAKKVIATSKPPRRGQSLRRSQ